ncbi:MAG: ABC transporter permease [Clostridia bacterium]|nr:ABC transporter permease [Clostridia bacterium]
MSNSKFKTALSEGIKKPGFLTICITLVMLILTAALQPGFFKGTTIGSNINTFAPLILLTMGQAVVIIAGGLDLSIGYAVSMLVVILTNIMQKDNPATAIPAILVAFVAAILVGVINGFSVGFLRLPPLIVTYATSYIWLGIGLFIAPSPAGQCVNWVRIFYTFSAIENLPPALATLGKTLPPSFWLIVIACIIWACIRKSRTGRHIYAVGSNSDSAYYSGINTANVQMKAYIICAVFTFLCALFYAAQNQSGDARMGNPMTLKSVAAAVIGGIALSGGKGSVFLAIAGAVTYSLVNKIIFFADISSMYQTLVAGVVVLVAVSLTLIYQLIEKRNKLKGVK